MKPAVTIVVCGSLFACTETRLNPEYCGNNDGDAYCAEQYPDGSRPYCELGAGSCISAEAQLGCVEARPADECYSPCGGRSTIAANGECVMVEDSSSGSSSGSGSSGSSSGSESSSTTGPVPCIVDEDCPDIGAPFCEPDSGECVRCDGTPDPDGACAALDPDVPLCVGGTCVACTPENPLICDEQLQLCDPGTNTCAPCTEHAQCEAGACDVFDGRCFDPDHVLHVGMGQPYASITAALDDVGAMMLDSAVLVLHQGVDFNETVTVDTGVLAIVAAEAEQPQWVNTAVMAPTVTVTGVGTRVYLHRVRLTQNGNDLGLRVDDGARVDIRRSRIVQNAGGGIVAQNGAELTLRNCFVGGDVNNTNAFELIGASTELLYSTIGGGFGAATALTCDAGSTVTVRNALLVTQDSGGSEVVCPTATIDQSVAEMDLGGTNLAVGDMAIEWFTGYATGDFHLTMMAPIEISTTAQWQLGDPPTDIDGDLRPTMDGTPDYAGADVPQP